MEEIFNNFAFTADSAWGRCLSSLLTSITNRHTHTVYLTHLSRFFSTSAGYGPPKTPDRYTREDMEWFVHLEARGKAKGASPGVSLRNQRIAVISSFYKYAASYTIMAEDGSPHTLLTTPSPTLGMHHSRRVHRSRAMRVHEVQRFFDTIPDNTVQGLRDRAIFLCFLFTARRREEIARLRFGDIERATIIEEDGHRRNGWIYHFYGKGHEGDQPDTAELPEPAREAIWRYLETSGRMRTIRPEDPLFVATDERRHTPDLHPLNSNTIAKSMKRYARLAGLDSRYSLHSWRHTSAQIRYAAGEDIRSLQRLLRHSNIATTDIYLRGLMGTADKGARLLEKHLGDL